MGYQALLFCPDEKLARVVSQVFSELDFSVEPVHEPFAAVKKLMAQRYDAIVVDCENEQNASLLFKSARNSSSNQSSLAIALVEGQAGVAKAYRIGANLVLTKPINVEQAKGTLRVARGLLRKNADAAGAAAPAPAMPTRTAPAPAARVLQPVSRNADAIASAPSRPLRPESEAPLPALIRTASPAGLPGMAASDRAADEVADTVEDKVGDKPTAVPAPAPQNRIMMVDEPVLIKQKPIATSAIENEVIQKNAVKNDTAGIAAAAVPGQTPISVFASTTGSAAATAPAKDVAVSPAPAKEPATEPGKEQKTRIVESEPTRASHAVPSHAAASHAVPPAANSSYDGAPNPLSISLGAGDAPSFAALGDEDSDGSGNKKIMVAAAIVLALAGLGYLGYEKFGAPTAAPTPLSVSKSPEAALPAPALAPVASPMASVSTAANSALSAKSTVATLDKPSSAAVNAPVTRITTNSSTNSATNSAANAAKTEPETKKADSSPMFVKSNAAATKAQTQADESAPQLTGPLADSSTNDSGLSGLMSVSPSLPKVPLEKVKISQGVSEGLLIKRVQPKYPQGALAVHAQGAVQIEATINKEGAVTNLKVLSGDPILARAAQEAVRQWRYKPYYLDGAPTEVQTQITVNFKSN